MKPVRADIAARIADLAALGREPGDDPLRLLEAALFIEETFSVLLSDEDISPHRLGTFAEMERLVAEKLGGV